MKQIKVIVLAHELFVTFINVLRAVRDGAFLLLPKKVVRGIMGEGTFAFIVHPRDLNDFFIPYPFARHLPIFVQQLWTRYWPPIIADRIEYQNDDGREMRGWLLATTMLAEDMFPPHLMETLANKEDEEKRKTLLTKRVEIAGFRVGLACKLAQRLGSRITGLGALTPAVTRQGKALQGHFGEMGITTGHAYTSLIIARYARAALRKVGMPFNNSVIAIVGAAGSTGNLIAQILSQKGPRFKKLVLVDRPHKLDTLRIFSQSVVGADRVEVSDSLSTLQQADVVVTVTNALDTILKREYLKAGAIVIDDAQPPNAGKDLLVDHDVVVLQVLCSDPGIRINFRWNIPQGTVFTCLGETLILAETGHRGDFAIGHLKDLKLVDRIRELERATGVRQSDFTSFGHRVPEEVWERARSAVNVRNNLNSRVKKGEDEDTDESEETNIRMARKPPDISIFRLINVKTYKGVA